MLQSGSMNESGS